MLSGAAKDLVFLHGAGHGSWCWEPLLHELRTDPQLFARIVTLDVPGAGVKRHRDPDSATITSIASELNQELRAANISDAVFVGHSLAGVLLPVMATQDPSLFSHLIFLHSIAPQEGLTVYEQTGTSLHGEDPEWMGTLIDIGSIPASELDATLFPHLFAPDLTRGQQVWLREHMQLDRTPRALLENPVSRCGYDPNRFCTAYVLAERDPVVPPDWQRRFAQRLGCERIIAIDTPHESFVSHPKVLAEVLRSLAS